MHYPENPLKSFGLCSFLFVFVLKLDKFIDLIMLKDIFMARKIQEDLELSSKVQVSFLPSPAYKEKKQVGKVKM